MTATAALYGPNDFHLVPDAELLDDKGKPRMIAHAGLGPEADKVLLAKGGTRAERAELDAERQKLELERQLFEEEKATFAREQAAIARSRK